MKLHIVDGTNMLYRAYFAMPKLTNSKGQPVGAVQGMLNTILYQHKDALSDKATHFVVVFDSKGGSQSRKEIFADYKGNRSGPEDDLIAQSKLARQSVKSLGISIIRENGIEADDLIATLTERFMSEHKKAKVVIHSGDKDMMQLIDKEGKVTVNNPLKKQIFDFAGAREVWGVDPWQIPQVQALIGDSIDNIPGCKGIGLKTAQKLFAEHGNLKGIIARAREAVTEKKPAAVFKNIVECEAAIKLSLKLAKLNRNLELEDFKWKHIEAKRIDVESGIKFCNSLELKSMSHRLMSL